VDLPGAVHFDDEDGGAFAVPLPGSPRSRKKKRKQQEAGQVGAQRWWSWWWRPRTRGGGSGESTAAPAALESRLRAVLLRWGWDGSALQHAISTERKPSARRRPTPPPPAAAAAAPLAPQAPKAKPSIQLKAGELAHAATNIPAATRQEYFGAEGGEQRGGAAAAGSFAALGVAAPLAEHLESLGFKVPTKVQQLSIPVLLRGRDALVRAPTGSGKTLSYVVPIAHDLQVGRAGAPRGCAFAVGAGRGGDIEQAPGR
jgi:hypothetical protein